jgi:hypothetical protein
MQYIDTSSIIDDFIVFQIQQASNATTTKNETKTILSNGGVGITVLINTVITVILLFVYIFFLQPCVTLYNVEKKSKLLSQVLKQQDDVEQQQQQDEQLDNTTNNNIDDGDLHSIFYDTKSIKNPILHGISVRLLFFWTTLKTLIIPSYRVKDRKMTIKRYGRDVAVYILFQQQVLYALCLCSIVGLGFLLPIHLTGEVPAVIQAANNETAAAFSAPLLKSSIEMRITQAKVLSVHVMLMILFCIVFAMFTIFWFLGHPLVSKVNYMRCDEDTPEMAKNPEEENLIVKVSGNEARPDRYRFNMMSRTGDKNLYLISPFCVAISGIPKKVDQQLFVHMMYQAAKEPKLVDDLQKVILIPSLSKRTVMQERLQILKDSLNSVTYFKERQPQDQKNLCDPSMTSICCAKDVYDGGAKRHIKQQVDAIDYYQKHIEFLSSDIDKYDNLYLENFVKGNQVESNDKYKSLLSDKVISGPKSSGFGFVVFRTVAAAQQFLKHYSATGIKLSKIKSTPVEEKEIEIPDVEEATTPNGTVRTPRSVLAVKHVTNVINKVAKQEQLAAVVDQTAAAVTKVTAHTEQLADGVIYKGKDVAKNINRLDILSFFSLRVEALDYEPKDIDWTSIFDFNKQRGAMRVIRQIFIFLLTIILFILFSSPSAVASGVQSILKLNGINVPVYWLVKITGKLGDFIFQYIPTLIVLITSTLIPIVIVKLTLAAQNLTYSIVQRRILWRSFLYLVLSTLIIPSLLLTTIDALKIYFNGKRSILELFTQLFLPGSGAFFINIIIQKALLSNSLALFRIGSLVFYLIGTRFTGRIWELFRMRRFITPLEELKAAELHCFILEQEYAYMHWILSITLAFSVFSPIVLPCGLLYFAYKYFIDRSIILDVYAHRRKHSMFGAAFGTNSDFISQHKMAVLQCILMLSNMFIFAIYQCLFYASKITGDRAFVVHTGISAAVCFVVLVSAILLYCFAWILRNRHVLKYYRNLKEDKVQITSEMAKNYFEVANTFNYLPHVPIESVVRNKWKNREQQEEFQIVNTPLETEEEIGQLEQEEQQEQQMDPIAELVLDEMIEVIQEEQVETAEL